MGFELDFLQVGEGNGDAICVRYGAGLLGQTIQVIDGGFSDTGPKVVKHINDWYQSMNVIEHVVLTHGDDDHARGLVHVLESFEVQNLWMNRPWLYASELINNFHGNYTVEGLAKEIRDSHPYLVELENVAARKNIPVRDAFAGTQIGAFTVLSPSLEWYKSLVPQFNKTPTNYGATTSLLGGIFQEAKKVLSKYAEDWGLETLSNSPDPTSASNESSIVQIANFNGSRVLLTADAGPIALERAFQTARELGLLGKLYSFQIPHHGSRRNVTPRVLDMWLGPRLPAAGERRGSALCSIGSNKDDYPRKRVTNACLRRGYGVFTNKPGVLCHSQGTAQRHGFSTMQSLPFTSEFEE